MKLLDGKNFEVLDVNWEMKKIYKWFIELLIFVINIVESLCKDVNERVKNFVNLLDVKVWFLEFW